MNSDCGILNPLQRDGTSQNHRLVKALHPSYVQVDERDLSALLRYAREYAGLLRYYKSNNQEDSNWVEFIQQDISTLVAMIAGTDLDVCRDSYQSILDDLQSASTAADSLVEIHKLFPLIASLIRLADSWYSQSIEGLALEKELKKLINSVLKDVLQKCRAHLRRLEEMGESVSDLELGTLNAIWQLPDFADVQADVVLYPSGTLTVAEEMEAAGLKLSRQLRTALDSLGTIIDQAPTFLEETLESYPAHQPHMALFITFLLLFKHEQDYLNTLTRKHLNYYYQEVLQLDLLPEVADEVHLVFELAKTFEQHKLGKASLAKAGKDDNKEEMLFSTDDELVINRGKLDEDHGLKTIFLEKSYAKDEEGKVDYSQYLVENIYAATDADSGDGQGAEIEEEDGKWLTLGGKSMPYGRVGFALASPMFLLKEGKRHIHLSFECENSGRIDFGKGNSAENVIAHELKHNLKVFLSGEEAWLQAQITEATLEETSGDSSKLFLSLEIDLDGGFDPVVPYDDKVLEEGLETPYPVLKIEFDNEGLAADYQLSCMDIRYLDTEEEVAEKVDPGMTKRILSFFNYAQKAEDIAGIEPQRGPVEDSPDTGSSPQNFASGYDIGLKTAGRILQRRSNLKATNGVGFTSLSEIMKVAGFGVDKMNDVIYTLCKTHIVEQDISAIKESSSLYDAAQTYEIGEIVFFEDNYYQALVPVQGYKPQAESDKWLHFPFSYPYKYFQSLDMLKLDIQVEVTGMKDLILENDFGAINPAKPFFPFGPQPKVGSAFYIGSQEVFQKRLWGCANAELTLRPAWADLPQTQSFNAHYENYTLKPATLNNNYFTVNMELLKEGAFVSLPGKSNVALFNSGTASVPNPVSEFEIENVSDSREPDMEGFSLFNVSLRSGFFRWVLNKDFFHKNYPASLSAAAIAPSPAPPNNEPYTPVFSSFELDYCAKESWDIASQDLRAYDKRIEQFFHLYPFGQREFYPIKEESSSPKVIVSRKLVPEFQVTLTDPETGVQEVRDAEGSLYLGIKDLDPEENLSILIQVADGSSNPLAETQQVVWSYLSKDRWIDFETEEVLSDASHGLLSSGIVKLAMPRAMSKDNSSWTPGLHWIKASVAQQTDAISQAIAVMPQAIKASFIKGENNDLDRLSKPLAAETISKLKLRQAAIKSVQQPFSSFGGKVKEQNDAPEGIHGEALLNKDYNEYYIRVSERLRHKGRGITIFDYERLVLQQFPDIYKAKCVNHTSLNSEHAPGHVKVVVLPNLRNKNAVDPLMPLVDLNTLDQVKNYLKGLISDFVQLEVKNPDFEQVQVSFNVKFHAGIDKGYYSGQLEQDIISFLSPWLFDEGEDLVLGGRIHRSWIINFIEELTYVDYVTDFVMKQLKTGESFVSAAEVEEAVASSSSSVLVSAASHFVNHNIHVACLNPLS